MILLDLVVWAGVVLALILALAVAAERWGILVLPVLIGGLWLLMETL